MSRINILSSKVFNRIAAGEVVERPFSVVKELVENSIDAGANNISIEIQNGGISFIEIVDNGCGIEKDDLKNALLSHATSKIKNVEDLDAITSLGFRGEALPSIASVSKITIQSKVKEEENGYSIHAEGGEVDSDILPCGIADGTSISVRNLFFNTPARAKFLKTERSEEAEITSLVARFILGNPNISFKYVADGKTIYSSYGDGEESAFVKVYGAKTLDDCFKIDTNKNGIEVKGYIGKHYFSKGNRTYMTTFINGRYVVNQTVLASIQNAYSTYLMKRQYPFCVLSINIPNEEVDVNVHPNKLDVRFSNNQIVYGTIYSTISKVLDGSSEALNIVEKNEKPIFNEVKTEENKSNTSENIDKNPAYVHENYNYTPVKNVMFSKIILNEDNSLPFDEEKAEKTEQVKVDIFAENKAYLEQLEREKQEKLNISQQKITIERELKYIGQALNTFLIFDDGEDLYLIDQHAAHERLLFDKFNLQVENSTIDSQPLLLPYMLSVSGEEYNFILSKIDVLLSMGFIIDEFGGNTFKVSAIPVFLLDMNLDRFFKDFLGDLNTLKSISVNSILKEKIAQKACKSAIKSGDKLSDNDVKILLEMLKFDLGLKCPHGRPIAVKITRTEIDKWFKRIV